MVQHALKPLVQVIVKRPKKLIKQFVIKNISGLLKHLLKDGNILVIKDYLTN